MNKSSHPKVLHIASGDLWAGAEAQLYTLAKTLHCSLDVPTSIILLNHGQLEQKLLAAGINVIVLDESKLNGIQILFRLVRIIRMESPDLTHTHRTKENILGSIATFLAGGLPSIRTAHGAPEHSPSRRQIVKRLILFIDWFCGRFMQQKIIAVSDDLGEILNKSYPSGQIQVIENGIDIDNIRKQIHDIKTEPKTEEKRFKIALAGRLVPVKRVDIFIATARYMLDHHPDTKVSFHIFGDGPLRKDLIKHNIELKTDAIVFFEGHCNNMAQMLHEMDTLLITSDHEGLPMILLEAMVLQTPIIAHAVGGIPKLLDQGSCGILVHKHNASGYGDEIHKLLTNPGNRSSIRKNAFGRVNTLYSSEKNARAYLSEYSLIADQQTNP